MQTKIVIKSVANMNLEVAQSTKRPPETSRLWHLGRDFGALRAGNADALGTDGFSPQGIIACLGVPDGV